MTCTYDGVLRVSSKSIEPCCESMHRAIIAGAIYRGDLTLKGSKAKIPCIKLRIDQRVGLVVFNCPFCGTKCLVKEADE